MIDPAELRAWLRLNAAEGVGPLSARKLLQAFGSPEAVFDASLAQLRQVVSGQAAHALLAEHDRTSELFSATMNWLETPAAPELRDESGLDSFRAVVTLADALYPRSLLRLEDPPLLLYVHARAGFWTTQQPLLDESPSAVAVVGSRNASAQGAIHARGFAKGLAEAGWTVVSGLALGIDAAAHEGAIEHAGSYGGGAAGTVAVIGTGIDRMYPKANAALARRIVQHGAILSEFPIGTPVLAHHFPRRNRIIAALSRGTLVVEAATQSGSLITARLSAELGREVFAIPGSIHSTHSKGCHALIKQGAALVESVQDILDAPGFGVRLASLTPHPSWQAFQSNLAPIPSESKHLPSSAPVGGTDPTWLGRMGHDPVELDELIHRTGEPAAILQAQLLELELLGRVQRLPGNLFQQIGWA